MPEQYFIIPDKSFTTCTVANSSSLTPMGRIGTTLTPASANVGSLTAFAFGTTTDANEYTFKIQDSGGLYETTYIWKDTDDADTLYRGRPDYRVPTVTCVPFNGTASEVGCSSVTGIFSSKLKKELLYCVEQDTYTGAQIRVFERTASDDETSLEIYQSGYPFTAGTINHGGTAIPFDTEYGTAENSCIDICELENGDLRLAVLNDRDIDIYHSTDGLNFSLIASKIVERFNLTDGFPVIRPAKIRISAAGNYLRIAFVDSLNSFDHIDDSYAQLNQYFPATSYHLYNAVSLDGGASWKFNDPLIIIKSKQGFHGWFFDICGITGETGEFLIAYPEPYHSNYNVIRYKRASGAGNFESISYVNPKYPSGSTELRSNGTKFAQTGSTPSTIYIANGQQYIWIFLDRVGGVPDLASYNTDSVSQTKWQQNNLERAILVIDKQYPLSEPKWIYLGNNAEMSLEQFTAYNPIFYGGTADFHTGYNGCRGWVPKSGKAYRIGSGIAFAWQNARDRSSSGNFNDWESGGAIYISTQPRYERYGNWQVRPISEYVHERSRLYGSVSARAWPSYAYKDLNRGVLCWYQWDISSGYPDPYVAVYQGGWSPGYYPSDDVLSGGWSRASGLWGWAWSNWISYISGNPTYEMPNKYCNGFKLISNQLGDRIRYYADDRFRGYRHTDINSYPTSSLANRGRGCPDRCWGYWFTQGALNMNGLGPHGVMIQACVTTDIYNAYGGAIEIKTYAGYEAYNGLPMERFATKLFVAFYNGVPTGLYTGKAVFEVFDYGNGTSTSRGTIEFDTDVTLPLMRSYYEIRMGCMPNPNSTRNTWYLSVRKTGTNTWKDLSFLAFDASYYSTSDTGDLDNEEQSVKWGNIFVGAAGGYWTKWLYIRVMNGQPMNHVSYNGGHSSRTYPDIVRGRILSESPTQIIDGQYISWGGYGGMEDDTYTLSGSYTYGIENCLKYQSPRVQYRSTAGPSQDIVLQAVGTTTFDSYFSQDSWAIFNSNSSSIELYGSNDDISYSSISSAFTHIYVATVIAADGNKMQVQWKTGTFDGIEVVEPTVNTLNKTQNITYNASLKVASPGSAYTQGKWDIKTHTGNVVYLETENSNYNTAFDSTLVGSTFYIHSPNTVIHSSSVQHYKYLKFTFQGTTGATQPENHFRIGTIVGGLSLNLNVPIQWGSSDDSLKENVTHYNTRSGIKWGYTEGPPTRTITGTVVGDIEEQQRVQFRNMVNSMVDISQYPIVFVINGDDYQVPGTSGKNILPDDIFLGELNGGVVLKNDGWYYHEEKERWMPIGNMSISITEVT